MQRWRKPENSALARTWRFSTTAAISRPLAGWMAPRSLPLRWPRTRHTLLCSASPLRTFSTLSRATRRFWPAFPTLARVAAWGGGFPIKVNGEVVGAIGLSGAPTVQNDVDCARAALAVVPDAVPPE